MNPEAPAPRRAHRPARFAIVSGALREARPYLLLLLLLSPVLLVGGYAYRRHTDRLAEFTRLPVLSAEAVVTGKRVSVPEARGRRGFAASPFILDVSVRTPHGPRPGKAFTGDKARWDALAEDARLRVSYRQDKNGDIWVQDWTEGRPR